jgi:hypothetical protein
VKRFLLPRSQRLSNCFIAVNLSELISNQSERYQQKDCFVGLEEFKRDAL